jgi:WD40 repeat protein
VPRSRLLLQNCNIRYSSFPTSTDFSPDGKYLFIGVWDGMLAVWDLHTRQVAGLLKDHSAAIWQVKVSPDGRTIATGGVDHTVILRDAGTRRQLIRLLGYTADILDLDFSADSRRLATVRLSRRVQPGRRLGVAELPCHRSGADGPHDREPPHRASVEDVHEVRCRQSDP